MKGLCVLSLQKRLWMPDIPGSCVSFLSRPFSLRRNSRFVTEVVNPCLEDPQCEQLPATSPFLECLQSQGQAAPWPSFAVCSDHADDIRSQLLVTMIVTCSGGAFLCTHVRSNCNSQVVAFRMCSKPYVTAPLELP